MELNLFWFRVDVVSFHVVLFYFFDQQQAASSVPFILKHVTFQLVSFLLNTMACCSMMIQNQYQPIRTQRPDSSAVKFLLSKLTQVFRLLDYALAFAFVFAPAFASTVCDVTSHLLQSPVFSIINVFLHSSMILVRCKHHETPDLAQPASD